MLTTRRYKHALPTRRSRPFDASKYSTRLIALKFAYLGQRYNGFEHHARNATPLPTIEEELWKALSKARLIFPANSDPRNDRLGAADVDWEGCEYSKCGRTDKGVSAFGQVIGARVRSNRPLRESEGRDDKDSLASASAPFDPVADELPYPQMLNRLLPPDIRVLAWCPSPPLEFSARFSCRERRYRYFFTQPAFLPPSPTSSSSFLDIPAMRAAARSFIGLHDFRNFCKVDASKQITNFQRRIFHADIVPVFPPPPAAAVSSLAPQEKTTPDEAPTGPPPVVYAFIVHGSAFLWHQVRHMAALLFLVGQRLEDPSIVSRLLDVAATPARPMYEMATDAPLVLWDCVFGRSPAANAPTSTTAADGEPAEAAEEAESAGQDLEWVYVDDARGRENGAAHASRSAGAGPGGTGVLDDLWAVWRARKMDEVLAASLLDVAAGAAQQPCAGEASALGDPPSLSSDSSAIEDGPVNGTTQELQKRSRSQRVFDGGNGPRLAGEYVRVLDKPRMESVEVINQRYLERRLRQDQPESGELVQ